MLRRIEIGHITDILNDVAITTKMPASAILNFQ